LEINSIAARGRSIKSPSIVSAPRNFPILFFLFQIFYNLQGNIPMSDKRKPRFGDTIGPWHRAFAWWPVRTYDQRLAWMRFIWRRCIQKHEYLYGGGDFWWQRSIEKP
jgi:hypothetical protein